MYPWVRRTPYNTPKYVLCMCAPGSCCLDFGDRAPGDVIFRYQSAADRSRSRQSKRLSQSNAAACPGNSMSLAVHYTSASSLHVGTMPMAIGKRDHNSGTYTCKSHKNSCNACSDNTGARACRCIEGSHYMDTIQILGGSGWPKRIRISGSSHRQGILCCAGRGHEGAVVHVSSHNFLSSR